MSVTDIVFRNEAGVIVRRMPSSLLDPFFMERGIILPRNEHPQSAPAYFTFTGQGHDGVAYFDEAPFQEGMVVASP